MKSSEFLTEFYDMESDVTKIAKMSHTRRPRLTLKHLNKLRKIRELKRFEQAKHDQIVQTIYQIPDSE